VHRYIIRQRYQKGTGQLSPPWINIADARSQAALTCVQYLTLDCFKLDLSDDEVSNFVHKGYYCFQDYAVVYWYDHVELSLSEASSGGPFVNSLLSALNLFLTRNWDSSKATEQQKKDRSVPIKVVQRLKVLQDTRFPEVFRKLTVLASARERPGAPSPFQFVNFRIQVGRARTLLEGQQESIFSTAQAQDLQKFYGHGFNHFKCQHENCACFSQGFASVRERQRHEGLHDRSFRCTETTCPFAEIGFATNAEFQSHLRSQHPENISFHETEVARTFNNDYDDYYHTFIVEASGQGQLDIVKSLVRDGIDINTQDTEGMTALHRACLGSHGDIVRFLVGLDHIALSGQDINGATPLIQAATIGHAAIVRLLLGKGGVDTNARTRSGETALIRAAGNGHEAVVRLLLERGDVDANAKGRYGETVLTRAAAGGHEAIVRLLVERSDADASSDDTVSAAFQAAGNGHEPVVQLLLERGAVDVNAQRTSRSGYTETVLIRAARHGHEAVVRLLLERDDVDANAPGTGGETALIRAAGNGHEAIVRLLLERDDVDANAQDKRGRTALIYAAGPGHEAVVRLLLERGAVDVNARDKNGKTALMHAAKNRSAIVKILLEDRRVDVNVKDNKGRTALMHAKTKGSSALLRAQNTVEM